jgi:hypothetical protein
MSLLSVNVLEWLSRLAASAQLRNLLSRQLEVVEVDISNGDVSFLDFAQLVIDLLGDGQLKQLILSKASPLTVPQTLENLQQGLCLLVESLPKLVHLKICMKPCHRSNTHSFDCMQMESWLSSQGESMLARHVHWRCQKFMIDLWL